MNCRLSPNGASLGRDEETSEEQVPSCLPLPTFPLAPSYSYSTTQGHENLCREFDVSRDREQVKLARARTVVPVVHTMEASPHPLLAKLELAVVCIRRHRSTYTYYYTEKEGVESSAGWGGNAR